MDERTRRLERQAPAEGPGGRLRLAAERLRSGARDAALEALHGLESPEALALRADVLFGLDRLEEAWAAAVAAVQRDPTALAPDLALPLARRLLAAAPAAAADPLPRLIALRRAVALGEAALDELAWAAQDPDPLTRGLAARLPALQPGLRDDPSPYVRFMAAGPDPDARANAWRRLAQVEVELGPGSARVPLPEGVGCHHLRLDVEDGALELATVRVHDERGYAHEARTVRDPGGAGRRAVCPIPGRATRPREVELTFAPGPGQARVGVWGDDTRPTATRLFGAHGPEFETDWLVACEARYPARLAFFEVGFFRLLARLLGHGLLIDKGPGEEGGLMVAYGGTYGLGLYPDQPRAVLQERLGALVRAGVLPFHLELTGPRPFDHLRGLAPSDTLSADDERLARRFAQDLRGHPARLEGAQEGALHARILGLFPPGRIPSPEQLDPLLDQARREYGPVGYRAVEAFVERAIAEAPGGAIGAPLGRPPSRRLKREEDQR